MFEKLSRLERPCGKRSCGPSWTLGRPSPILCFIFFCSSRRFSQLGFTQPSTRCLPDTESTTRGGASGWQCNCPPGPRGQWASHEVCLTEAHDADINARKGHIMMMRGLFAMIIGNEAFDGTDENMRSLTHALMSPPRKSDDSPILGRP